MNIVIKNTEPRLVQLPPVAPKVATGKEILKDAVMDAKGVMVTPPQYMDPGTLIAEGYDLQQLTPGENDVDYGYWKHMCMHRGVKRLIAVGTLVNMGEGKAASLVADLDKVDMATAKRMITECTNIGMLTKWAEATEKRGLHTLITERKGELIANADGRPKGRKIPDVDMGTFGERVSARASEGSNEPSHGIGEQV